MSQLKDFFDTLTNGEKIASITSTLCTWFCGIFLMNSPIWEFTLKGIMWLVALVAGSIIPKITSTFYDEKLKDKIFKPKKDGKQKTDNEKRA